MSKISPPQATSTETPCDLGLPWGCQAYAIDAPCLPRPLSNAKPYLFSVRLRLKCASWQAHSSPCVHSNHSKALHWLDQLHPPSWACSKDQSLQIQLYWAAIQGLTCPCWLGPTLGGLDLADVGARRYQRRANLNIRLNWRHFLDPQKFLLLIVGYCGRHSGP